jgi:hypothetical protein
MVTYTDADAREALGWAMASVVSALALSVLLALMAGCGAGWGHGSSRGVLLCGDDASYLAGPGGSRVWLVKVYGPDWRDPARDVPPDGSPCEWVRFYLSTLPPSAGTGPLRATPWGTGWPLVADGPGGVARAPTWVREYVDTSDPSRGWRIVRLQESSQVERSACLWRTVIHAREAWKWADVHIEW